MGYKEELKEQALKRKRQDFRFKMILLVIFLIIILVAMRLIDNFANNPSSTPVIKTNRVERIPNQSETN